MSTFPIIPSLFEFRLSEPFDEGKSISKTEVQRLIDYFAGHQLFSWDQSHNGCEARADAVCLLLESWGIPNYKAWVFSGKFLKKHVGELKQNWKYHVAAMVPVAENGTSIPYVIDPSSSPEIQTLYDWAANVTAYAHSYHFIKSAEWYIFHNNQILPDNWHRRNKRNRRWMIQGLANINGLTPIGKAAITFNKGRIKNMETRFDRELHSRSPLSNTANVQMNSNDKADVFSPQAIVE